ncbi:MAG: hypothetical protein JRC90_04765 [Deltaproteobacteria bacterium]|nr:hypothetical protein [Deltaproteobacteria bacterium]
MVGVNACHPDSPRRGAIREDRNGRSSIAVSIAVMPVCLVAAFMQEGAETCSPLFLKEMLCARQNRDDKIFLDIF